MSSFSLLSLFAPGFLLGALLCLTYASLAHLWTGRSLRDLVLFIAVSAIGFFVGQLLGVVTQISLLQVGQLYLLEGTIGTWLLLAGVQAARA